MPLSRRLRHPFRSCALALWRLALICFRRRCGSVWIVDGFDDGNGAAGFADQIDRALRYIEGSNPRRARSVLTYLDTMVNHGPAGVGGLYISGTNVCYVNYAAYRAQVADEGSLSPRDQEVLTLELAQLIVHEATHARIDRWGVKYDESRRERIEKRCRREECRFVERAAPDFHDLHGDLIDWEAQHDFESARPFYRSYWKTTWMDRVRHSLQSLLGSPEASGSTSELAATLAATWREQHSRYCEAASASPPWTEKMLRSRGLLWFGAHDYRLAAVDLKLVNALDPENDDKRHWLALANFYQRRLDAALQLWLESHRRGDCEVVPWISYVLTALNRDAEALEWLERESDVDCDEFEFLTSRAIILVKLGRYQEGLLDYDRAWDGRDVDLEAGELTVRAMHTWLLKELGESERFSEIFGELCSLRSWWCSRSASAPRLVDAFVAGANDEIYEPGVVSGRGYLLVCLDEVERADVVADFDRIAVELKAARERDGGEPEQSYLRSLLRVNDEYPWRELPENLTKRRIYVVDVTLDRAFLPGGLLTGPWVKLWVAENDSGHRAMLAGSYMDSDQLSAATYGEVCHA